MASSDKRFASLEEVNIETPMCKTTNKMLEGEDIATFLS